MPSDVGPTVRHNAGSAWQRGLPVTAHEPTPGPAGRCGPRLRRALTLLVARSLARSNRAHAGPMGFGGQIEHSGCGVADTAAGRGIRASAVPGVPPGVATPGVGKSRLCRSPA
jgi:hypothetical protein